MKMISKNIALALSIVLVSFTITTAQNKNIRELEKYAFKAFKGQEYAKALPMFLQLDNMSNDPVRYDYMIGMCYLSTDQKQKALPYLESGKNHPTTSWVVNYYLGRAYMIQQEYEKAGKLLQIYSDSLTSHIARTGMIFKDGKVTESNRIHMEKTPEKVSILITYCDALVSGTKSYDEIKAMLK